MPVPKKAAASRPLFLGPIFSTKLPRKPADSPKNRMAMEKTQVISFSPAPISAIMGLTSTLQA